jgi:hypothetical protein
MVINDITNYNRTSSKTSHASDKPAGRLLVNRHELKYVISESQAAIIKELLKPHLQLDRYCQVQPDREYPISSLYLDSHDLRLFQESISGCKSRFKLRIRRYSDDPSTPSFFEIKRRMNRVIIKNRAKVYHNNIEELLLSPALLYKNENGDADTLRQFQLYMSSICARPVVQIRYMREAYEGALDSKIRITFDRKLAYKIASKAEVTLDGGGWHYYPMEGVILEIKFTEFYPPWLSHVAKCLELCQQSVSKYTRSIKHACALKFCAPKAPIKM